MYSLEITETQYKIIFIIVQFFCYDKPQNLKESERYVKQKVSYSKVYVKKTCTVHIFICYGI
jgi:hypothetical protein